jgi:DNA-binding HxlR family transcriptional regulator
MSQIAEKVDRQTAPTKAGTVPHPAGIFDPVARGLDVIGDRWTLVLVRHLLDAPRGFQELRKRTGIAPRVLSSRLRGLLAAGFIDTVADGSRSVYVLTEQGRSLRPIITSIARWWICHGLFDLAVDAERFTETSAQSVMDALPFMVREDRARDVDITFEIRLSGTGGGVWTVRVANGECTVRNGFTERADVRYTADSRDWCGLALGLADAHDFYKRGLITKEGGREAMDHYFHQVAGSSAAEAADETTGGSSNSTNTERSTT